MVSATKVLVFYFCFTKLEGTPATNNKQKSKTCQWNVYVPVSLRKWVPAWVLKLRENQNQANKHKTELKRNNPNFNHRLFLTVWKSQTEIKSIWAIPALQGFPCNALLSTEAPVPRGSLRKQRNITITQVTKWDRLSPFACWNFQLVPNFTKNKENSPNCVSQIWEMNSQIPRCPLCSYRGLLISFPVTTLSRSTEYHSLCL